VESFMRSLKETTKAAATSDSDSDRKASKMGQRRMTSDVVSPS